MFLFHADSVAEDEIMRMLILLRNFIQGASPVLPTTGVQTGIHAAHSFRRLGHAVETQRQPCLLPSFRRICEF